METGAPLGVGRRRGVCYDVGRVLYGDWRKDYSPALVHRELEIIARDLHCNAVRICARDVDRLVVAAKYALGMGLEVWLSPELWNKSPKDTLNHLLAAAEAAEELRKAWPEQVVLSVGTELTLFMKGIVPGRTLWQRSGVNLCMDTRRSADRLEFSPRHLKEQPAKQLASNTQQWRLASHKTATSADGRGGYWERVPMRSSRTSDKAGRVRVIAPFTGLCGQRHTCPSLQLA